MEATQQQIIEAYLEAYNNFDIEGMLKHLHNDLVFENISDDEVNMRLEGKAAFKAQAEAASAYFKSRKQTVRSWNFDGDTVTIDLNYEAVLAQDFPNGLKTGATLSLTGKSIFEFFDGKVMRLVDKS